MKWGSWAAWVDSLTRALASRPTEQGSLMARAAILQKPGALALVASLIPGAVPSVCTRTLTHQSTPPEGLDPSCRLPYNRKPVWDVHVYGARLTVCLYDMGR